MIDLKNMPDNVTNMLEAVGQASIINEVVDPLMGEFWQFNEPGGSTSDDLTLLNSKSKRRRVLIQESKN